jgi:hypothetical protein
LIIIEEKDRRIAELKRQVQWFMEQIRLAKRRQFGISSEQTNAFQINLFNEAEAAADLTAPEPSLSEVKAHYRKKRTRLTTDKLPEDLPVEIIEHELPESERVCPDCGSELHTMGRETREELKIIPAKAVIVRHVRYVYSCRKLRRNIRACTGRKGRYAGTSHKRKFCVTGNDSAYSGAKIHDGITLIPAGTGMETKWYPAIKTDHVKLAYQSL